ncbi:MAG: Trm112 family protein [Desulfovibrionaceae bacterium]|nr:Trm112 family protein [Desulfovibrionaceae bacterium]MDD4952154.1 Trm112 family protein [Desulfovibrionaceae bacterium]
MALNRELLELLACPKCKGKLELLPGERGLACDRCRVVYPVKDEIPIMLVEEAVPRDQWDRDKD